MPTKYELQAQLRDLNRGYPRIPISKMKMHELEGAIDAMKKIKEEIATKTPALPGPKGPRVIPVEDVESGPVTIRTPKMPPVRNVGVPKGKKPGKAISEDPDTSDLFPAVKSQSSLKEPGPESPPPRQKSKAMTICMCNCPSCPSKHKSA